MRFPRRVIHDPARRCSTAVMLALVMVTCSIVSSFPVRTGQTPQTSIRRITWSYSALASHPQSSSSSLYRYRTAQESDLPGIAKLLDETFENDEIQVGDMSTSSTSTSSTTTTTKKSWWNLCKSNPKQSSNNYNNNNDDDQSTIHFRQLQRRWMDLVQNPNVPHTWIVAERLKRTTTTTTSTNAIAGFMELGTMPSPIPIPKTNSNTIESKEGNVNENQQFTTSSTKTWHGIEITSSSSSSSTYPTTESSTSSTSSRRPERPFLANLAVSFDHRRQGIGKKLVQLAMKISKKWKEDNKNDNDNNKDDNGNSTWSMYLSVDKDNHAAVQLYQQLHFTIVLDESLVLPSKTLKQLDRPIRLYFEKTIV